LEFGTECSSAAIVAKSCHPNARYRILVTPEGENPRTLGYCLHQKGDEITIDVGALSIPRCSASADLSFMLTEVARRQAARVLLSRVCTVIYLLWPWSLLDLPQA
jgi:hypothetical protein